MAAWARGAGRTEGTEWAETLRPKKAAHYSQSSLIEGREEERLGGHGSQRVSTLGDHVQDVGLFPERGWAVESWECVLERASGCYVEQRLKGAKSETVMSYSYPDKGAGGWEKDRVPEVSRGQRGQDFMMD